MFLPAHVFPSGLGNTPVTDIGGSPFPHRGAILDVGGFTKGSVFYCYILYLLFDVRILNVALYVLRHGMYACVRRWAICIRLRGVWLSTGIDVRLRRASKMYMTVLVSIPRGYMRIDDVRF